MERKTEMMQLRNKRWTLKMIATKYGISRQRVAQIIGKTGTITQIITREEKGKQIQTPAQ